MANQTMRRTTTLTRDADGKLAGATAIDEPIGADVRVVRVDSEVTGRSVFLTFASAYTDDDVVLQIVQRLEAIDAEFGGRLEVLESSEQRLHLTLREPARLMLARGYE